VGRLSHAFNEMTSRLQAARNMQVDFVANVSHDLRTPLTAVKGLVETLRDGAVDDALVRDRFLETVESETDRLIRLVNDLLVLSRADSHALNLRRAALDPVDLVHGVAERLTPQADGRGISLHVEVGQPIGCVLADRDRIDQVLVNLLDNAIKYSHPNADVRIGVERLGDDVVQFSVQDKGIGIPEAELPRIGERFYRVDRARARAEGGSGLGLAIARALVEAHGGQLWLESEPGQGTVVGFTLPLA
jgi:signal transduction histidine kinase